MSCFSFKQSADNKCSVLLWNSQRCYGSRQFSNHDCHSKKLRTYDLKDPALSIKYLLNSKMHGNCDSQLYGCVVGAFQLHES